MLIKSRHHEIGFVAEIIVRLQVVQQLIVETLAEIIGLTENRDELRLIVLHDQVIDQVEFDLLENFFDERIAIRVRQVVRLVVAAHFRR